MLKISKKVKEKTQELFLDREKNILRFCNRDKFDLDETNKDYNELKKTVLSLLKESRYSVSRIARRKD